MPVPSSLAGRLATGALALASAFAALRLYPHEDELKEELAEARARADRLESQLQTVVERVPTTVDLVHPSSHDRGAHDAIH